MNKLDLVPRIEVKLEMRGKTILNDRIAAVLEGIEKYGSLLEASRRSGVPYSRAWEGIAKLERILGSKVIEPRRGGRGGGGTKLTKLGKTVLLEYRKVRAMVDKCVEGYAGRTFVQRGVPDLVVAGSNDHALEILIGILREGHPDLDVEIAWIGSAGGLASLMLEEADIAGVHLLDPETGTYNIPYLEKYWLKGRVRVIRGYKREIGIVSRPENRVTDLALLFEGKLKFINRNLGSGTRVLLECLLKKKARERGMNVSAFKRIKGFEREVRTHLEVARAVARGEADVGVALRYVAHVYGLSFTPLTWEDYDFVLLESRISKNSVKAFISTLRSDEFRESLEKIPGYRVPPDMGDVIY
ncbi:MAG: hypothetical protein DRO05_08275 [Thermoproteota archaeon]|nr:MAG: hypothetical protein DRO05_08275 [Candidatus Korarchaeota archaeon]